MEYADIAVVGAGPAGLSCAVFLAGEKIRLVVLEKNKNPGTKLMLSGSGQCNLTHDGSIQDFLPRYGAHGRFLKHALHSFTNTAMQNFFSVRHVPVETAESGKVFPASRRAADIRDLLLRELKNAGARIFSEEPVISVKKSGPGFVVTTNSHTFMATYLVLATGGLSYPATGSTGEGYRFAQELGHTITPVYPALAPVTIRDFALGDLAGMTFSPLAYSVWRENKKILEHQGDVVITHTGLSGPGILDRSRSIRPGDRLLVCFARGSSREELINRISGEIGKAPKKSIKNLLLELSLPERLVRFLIVRAGMPLELTGAHLSAGNRQTLVGLVTSFPLDVAAVGGFSCAMATSGGVLLEEVNQKTMESRVVSNLYFAGEILDIDGDSGGYNIQAAFSTGYLAAQSIREKMGRK
ncbi:MAG: NAD(P)/FAD-dependent oxidoreductase [Methanoregula sp.]|jgi:hypothetical protein